MADACLMCWLDPCRCWFSISVLGHTPHRTWNVGVTTVEQPGTASSEKHSKSHSGIDGTRIKNIGRSFFTTSSSPLRSTIKLAKSLQGQRDPMLFEASSTSDLLLLSCRNWFKFSNQEWAQCSCLLKVKGATMHNIADPDPVCVGCAVFCHVSAGHTLRLRPWGPIDLLWFFFEGFHLWIPEGPNAMKLVATTRFFDTGWDWVVPEVVRGSSWKFCEADSGPTGAGGSPSGFFHPRRGANH